MIGLEQELRDAVVEQDQVLAALGLDIWIGGEPTFTDRFSESPCWLGSALGGDKEQRAGRLLGRLAAAMPGAAVLRTLGRQYPGEPVARWSLGLYGRRDGAAAWNGPPDPLLGGQRCDPDALRRFHGRLADACAERAWATHVFDAADPPSRRLLVRMAPESIPEESRRDPRVLRPSVHRDPIPPEGITDTLAAAGLYLLILDLDPASGCARLELPAVAESARLLALLEVCATAATAAELPGLLLRGFPPPVDASVAWTTLTPDPAVIEANLAPARSLGEYLELNQTLFQAAEAEGLTAYRLHYNGRQTDSGGGGQLTLGGPTPHTSPFVREPRLLPRLIRYFNHHPSLSYWLAPDYVGAGSQAPRADEGLREMFLELDLALSLLARHPCPEAELLWHSLSPFLADPSGNSHRSEINIEKLWNPWLDGRGKLGLVELRPFRMMPDLNRLTALAALVRALAARLARGPYEAPLVDWGDRLHDRFALPFFLRQDLEVVLADLGACGFGLPDLMARHLLDDSARTLGEVTWGGCRVNLSQAVEFWPLVGESSTARPSDSRLVDASTARVELRVSADGPGVLRDLRLRVNGYTVPLYPEAPDLHLRGIRYRTFLPAQGLHPTLPAQAPLELLLSRAGVPTALRLRLHEWRPGGGAYEGLPRDPEEARRRRSERLVMDLPAAAELGPGLDPPPGTLSEYGFDLRRVEPGADQDRLRQGLRQE